MVCRKCGSVKFIPYGDFIKLKTITVRHFKCVKCGKANMEIKKYE